jgi:hypothetical protein
MKRYRVTFYQCAVLGIPDEHYATISKARKNACEFLRELLPMPGHRRTGSVYRDGYARITDMCGATEALSEVHKVTS